ncbi:CX3C chemokine receptor 1-like [Arapaima gigas]
MNTSDALNFSTYHVDLFEEVVGWIILCVGFPLLCLSCYALYKLVKADYVTPIYVINLLLSDLVQIIVRLFFISQRFIDSDSPAFKNVLFLKPLFLVVVRFGLVASLGFMVCISLERYLVVVHPLWYRFHRNVKHSILVSLVVWVLAAIYAAVDYNVLTNYILFLQVFSTIFFLPFPVLVFLYLRTKKALSKTVGVSASEKKRIQGALALVLGIYVLFNLPFTFMSFFLTISLMKTYTVYCLMAIARSMVRLSPLVDPFLYIYMRKSVRDTVEAFPCFRGIFGWSMTSSSTQCEAEIDMKSSH